MPFPRFRFATLARRGLAALLVAAGAFAAPQEGLGSAVAHAAEPTAPALAFRAKEDVLAWITAYRDDPAPQYVPLAVKAMARHGLLQNPERNGVYIGFVAGVLADNQPEAKRLVASMFPLPPASQVVVIRAIAYSGLPEWKELLKAFVERMPARKVMIRRYLFGEAKPLQDLPLETGPHVLDAWWGVYFATGAYAPARRIIRAAAMADKKDNLEKLTVGHMAKWTLASNATQDKTLLDFMRAELPRHSQVVRRHLQEAVRAAETFETHKLRKAAVASINTLRTKGPESRRKWVWWGQAGQIALAFGCVVASATGHVELGLPCIIGGAASSAALKMFSLSQDKP